MLRPPVPCEKTAGESTANKIVGELHPLPHNTPSAVPELRLLRATRGVRANWSGSRFGGAAGVVVRRDGVAGWGGKRAEGGADAATVGRPPPAPPRPYDPVSGDAWPKYAKPFVYERGKSKPRETQFYDVRVAAVFYFRFSESD